jgi:hypothetical protein
MTMKKGLLGIVGTAVLLSVIGVGLIKSFQDNYYGSKPGVVYMVNGKPVIERRFNTNEQFQEYLNSERGKQEAEFYLAQNKH